MTHHIFFSWQSDTPNAIGRNLIDNCLRKAIKNIQADAELDPAIRKLALDRDTLATPGTPPIMETIFGKIARSAVFVADMTYVAKRTNTRRSPNPNVLIEYGWALRALSWRRMILVMNIAAGDPDRYELPFDLRHMRRPIFYNCSARAGAKARKAAREELTKAFTGALKAIFTDEAATDEMRPPAPAEPHPHDTNLLREVHTLLSQNTRYFLHEHDFGNSFPRARLSPVFEIADWKGAAYEFHDRVLQTGFVKLRAAVDAFAEVALVRIHALDRNPDMASAETDLDRAQGIQRETLNVIRQLNDLATGLSEAIDEFDRLARNRIRIASKDVREELEARDPRAEKADAALGELVFDINRGGVPQIVSRPRVALRLVPYAAMEGRRLEPAKMKALQARFPLSQKGRVQMGSDARQWWACAEPTRRRDAPNPETSWLMRVVRPGTFEYQATIGTRMDDDPEIVIDGRKLEAKIVGHLERMAGFAQELGFTGPGLFSVYFDGMEDVILMRPGPGGRRMRVPDLAFATVVSPDLGQPIAPQLQEGFDILWQSAGWSDGSTSYEHGKWAGYGNPHDYAWDD